MQKLKDGFRIDTWLASPNGAGVITPERYEPTGSVVFDIAVRL